MEKNNGYAHVGIHGNFAYALFNCEVEMVPIQDTGNADANLLATVAASKEALHRLRGKVNMPDLAYRLQLPHPFANRVRNQPVFRALFAV